MVEAALESLGLEANIWTGAGYPANPGLDPLEACIEAVGQHDLVVALLDAAEGTELKVARLLPETANWLERRGILTTSGGEGWNPTVVQAEVRVAIALEVPLLVLAPTDVLLGARSVLRDLESGYIRPAPRAPGSDDLERLIADRDWQAVLAHYDVPARSGMAFRHIAFLEWLRSRVWVSGYAAGDMSELAGIVRGRVALLPVPPLKRQRELAERRLSRKRNPLDPRSLDDLRRRGLVVQPPYTVHSGGPRRGVIGNILPDASGPGWIAERVLANESVLILGQPGMGKTSAGLLIAHGAASDPSIPHAAVLVVPFRELTLGSPDAPISGDELVRAVLGDANQRAPWPSNAPMPNRRFQFVFDGLDEANLRPGSLRRLLEDVSATGSMVVTCREADYARGLHHCADLFDHIVRLEPWGESEVAAYVETLVQDGRQSAAEHVTEQSRRQPMLLGRPLWLACLAFLYDKGIREDAWKSDFGLLLACAELLVIEECRHAGLDDEAALVLSISWERAAWLQNRSRRLGQNLEVSRLLGELDVMEGSPLASAVLSQIEVRDGRIVGFHHDVFRDYWLAQGIIRAAIEPGVGDSPLPRLLGVQRSPFANRLIRDGIRSKGSEAIASAALMEAYRNSVGEWEKNQLLYLLGRLDATDATRDFLAKTWSDPSEPLFVRYSAGWAATLAGSEPVESEFFAELRREGELDELNRAYHRIYYSDSRSSSVAVPAADDLGPALNAIAQIVRRLSESHEHYLSVRRIEVFTLLRLLQTRTVDLSGLGEEVGVLLGGGMVIPDVMRQDIEEIMSKIRELLEAAAANIASDGVGGSK